MNLEHILKRHTSWKDLGSGIKPDPVISFFIKSAFLLKFVIIYGDLMMSEHNTEEDNIGTSLLC